jgi:Leucine-rich repeat (LRR) protein
VSDITSLTDLNKIQRLDFSDCPLTNISAVKGLHKLIELRLDRTQVDKLDPAFGLVALKKVYIDQSTVHDIIAREFLERNPDCLIVYKTNHLNRWWHSLAPEWKDVFRSQMGTDTTTSRENLHRLAERQVLTFKDAAVRDLSVLNEFVRLRDLHFSGTGINSIPALENLITLKSLHASSSPIQDIRDLGLFKSLEDLDLSNTPIDELKPISTLQTLQKLNCAGSQIKKLDALKNLSNLESLDCSNTKVAGLDAVEGLPLKSLKCYNTKISEREVKKFREMKPDCSVVFYR